MWMERGDRFMSTVKVGEKGQFVIPKGARDMFGIKPGDTLLLLGSLEDGMALVSGDRMWGIMDGIIKNDKELK